MKHHSTILYKKKIPKNSKKIFDQIISLSAHLGGKPLKIGGDRLFYPSMTNYFLGVRHKLIITNPQLLLKEMVRALFLATHILRDGGQLLIVDTNDLSIITFDNNRNPANPPALSSSGNHWVGGTLTNWKKISKMVERYGHLSRRFEKFFNGIAAPRYEKMKNCYPGLLTKKYDKVVLGFKKVPDLLFVVNPSQNQHVIAEANILKIPTIALIDSSTNLAGITFPIPVHKNSKWGVYFCINFLVRFARCITVLNNSSGK